MKLQNVIQPYLVLPCYCITTFNSANNLVTFQTFSIGRCHYSVILTGYCLLAPDTFSYQYYSIIAQVIRYNLINCMENTNYKGRWQNSPASHFFCFLAIYIDLMFSSIIVDKIFGDVVIMLYFFCLAHIKKYNVSKFQCLLYLFGFVSIVY